MLGLDEQEGRRAAQLARAVRSPLFLSCLGRCAVVLTVVLPWRRFFHLDPSGVLTYYENCNAIGIKKGGSTKMRLLGVEEKGTLNIAEISEIRLGTAPNATNGELELLTAERAYRLRVGRTAGGTKKISDPPGAVAVWIACLNLARVALLEKSALEAGRPLRSAIVAVRSALSAGNPSRDSFEHPIDLAVHDAVMSVSAIGVGRGGAGPGSGFFKGSGGAGAATGNLAAPAPALARLRAPPSLEEDVLLGRPMTLSASTTGLVSGSPGALRKSSRSVSVRISAHFPLARFRLIFHRHVFHSLLFAAILTSFTTFGSILAGDLAPRPGLPLLRGPGARYRSGASLRARLAARVRGNR